MQLLQIRPPSWLKLNYKIHNILANQFIASGEPMTYMGIEYRVLKGVESISGGSFEVQAVFA